MLSVLFLDSKSTVSRLIDIDQLSNYAVISFLGERLYGDEESKLTDYDLVVQTHYPNLVHQSLIILCLKLKIKTVFIFDGVFDWSNTYNNPKHIDPGLYIGKPFLHDFVMLVSGGDAYKYLSYKNPSVKFVNYLPIRNRCKNMIDTASNANTILITTANTAYFNEEEYDSLVTIVKDTIQACQKLNVKVIFRVFDENLIRSLRIESNNYINCSLYDVLSISTAVISTPSTLNVDVVSHGLPLANFIYRDSPVLNSGGWVVYNRLSASSAIKHMLGRDGTDFLERMEFQKSLVSVEDLSLEDIANFDNTARDADIRDLECRIKSFTTFSYMKLFISQTASFIKKLRS